MSRFILALCTGTLALGLALALPISSQAAVPVNAAPFTAAAQPVGYCYPHVYYPYGSWRSHHHYHHYHHRRHWR